jgi:hypothetical protein
MCRKLEMISLLKNQGREFLLLEARILVSAHPAITLTRCFFRHRTSGGGTQPAWCKRFSRTTDRWKCKSTFICVFCPTILGKRRRHVCQKLPIPCHEIAVIVVTNLLQGWCRQCRNILQFSCLHPCFVFGRSQPRMSALRRDYIHWGIHWVGGYVGPRTPVVQIFV